MPEGGRGSKLDAIYRNEEAGGITCSSAGDEGDETFCGEEGFAVEN